MLLQAYLCYAAHPCMWCLHRTTNNMDSYMASHLQAPSSAEDAADAMEQFRKVFGKFASAEEVTGTFVREDSDDEDESVSVFRT